MKCSRQGLALLACLVCLGCMTPYRPPTASEPHAVLKFRRTYQKSVGTSLRDSLTIERHPALSQVEAVSLLKGPRASALLMHPGAAELSAVGTFFHEEMRTVQEHYTVQEPYSTTESYNCGSGSEYRTCSRSVTHYRSVQKYRTVTKMVEVIDSTCSANLWLKAFDRGVYLLEFQYQDSQVCRLSCFAQTSLDNGDFKNEPCPLPDARERKAAMEAR